MLRIVEKDDGRTFVYNSTKTRLLCVIKEERRQFRNESFTSKAEEPVNGRRRRSKNISCTIDDQAHLSKKDFLRCFNLIPSSSLDCGASVLNDQANDSSTSSRDSNATNRNPCLYGYRYPVTFLYELDVIARHHILNRSMADLAVQKYERCCRPLTVCPLRSTSVSEYPVVYKPRNGHIFSHNHQYLFNKRQKMERLRTLSTGLNKKSRVLLSHCRKSPQVCLKRLSASEIRCWIPKGNFDGGADNKTVIRANKRKFSEDTESVFRKAKSSKYKENIGVPQINGGCRGILAEGCNSNGNAIFLGRCVPPTTGSSQNKRTFSSLKNGQVKLCDGFPSSIWTEAAKLFLPDQIQGNLRSLYSVVKAKYFDKKPLETSWT